MPILAYPIHFPRLRHTLPPPRALALSFALLIFSGAFLLMLPGVTHTPEGLDFVDALFTSTSAVCVTGLVVTDTGTEFTFVGQSIILALIQMGGLGIMTFSVFFVGLVRMGSSLRDELAVRSGLSILPQHDVPELVKTVMLYTLTIELVGAGLLFLFIHQDYSTAEAVWMAVFHSVSAFCNAGFSLFADSLTRYQTNWGVNLIVIGLIVAGGLGFIVLHELMGLRLRSRRRLSLHSKIVMFTSATLIMVGLTIFLLLERQNVLSGTSIFGDLIIGLFQSVTTRTAGFNTIEFNHLTNSTLLTIIFLMFIGGSPGSTAGGVKTVPLALLVAMAVSRFRGFSRVNLFKRSIEDEIIHRGLTIILVGIAVVFSALSLLLITETGHIDHTQTRDIFLKLLFETVSAFATVGLSMGVTAGLTAYGKLIIIMTMFLGRVGPLTVALAMTWRSTMGKAYNFGTEEVLVG